MHWGRAHMRAQMPTRQCTRATTIATRPWLLQWRSCPRVPGGQSNRLARHNPHTPWPALVGTVFRGELLCSAPGTWHLVMTAHPLPEHSAPSTSTLAAGDLTPAERAEGRRYGRAQFRLQMLDKLIDLVYLGVVAWLVAVPLDRQLARLLPHELPRFVALFLLVMLGHELLSFPLAFVAGHGLERRFGLARQSAARWLVQHLKHFALAVGFSLLMFGGLLFVVRLVGAHWWWVAAGMFFLVSVVLGQLFPVLILPLFYRVERLDDDALGARLARLAEGTGLAIAGVYRLVLSEETVKANAMLAGLGRTRRVLLGDTLLADFSPEEIDVIFAHEIGHHVHRHLPQLLGLGLVTSAAGFWCCNRALCAWLGIASFSVSALPVFAVPMLMWLLVVFWTVMEPLQNAVSRHFERQSDRYALARTGRAEAYISAFQKLARLNKDDPEPHPWEVWWLHSHPPIAERLALAQVDR